MSFIRALGFFLTVLSFILFYMNYTWYQEYNSALKGKKAMFKIKSCKSVYGNLKKTFAYGELEGIGLSGAVNLTEYLKYLKKNNPNDNFPSTLEICNEKGVIPVWQYDIGILRGRDTSKNLQSDSIRASHLNQSIKKWLFLSIVILIIGLIMVKTQK